MKKENPKVKILIAYHKDTYRFKSDILTPIHVGRAIADKKTKKQLSDIIGDDTEDNISKENTYYCELTAMYWAWKNFNKLGDPDYIGLAHYRRFLKFNENIPKFHHGATSNFKKYIPYLKSKDIINHCSNYDLIIPKRDFIADAKLRPQKNIYEQYKTDHHINDLELVESIVKTKQPKFYKSFKKTVYKNNFVYWCNMFLIKREYYFEYCDFLFSTLGEVKAKISINDALYDGYQSRVLGFLSERLLNVYIQYLKDNVDGIKIEELPVLNIGEYFTESRTTVKKTNTKIKLLFSFDIFDTIITRQTANPTGVFCYMEYILKNRKNDIPSRVINNFSFIRQETESLVRNSWRQCYSDNPYKRDEQDITIDDIYRRFKETYNLTPKQTNYIKRLEINSEKKLIIPIPKNIQKIKNLSHDKTKKVVLISDTYLTETILKKILSEIDPIFKKITIYASSEIKKTKATGDIYKYIKKQEGIEYNQWIHTGDNYNSDVIKAKELGIQSIYFRYPQLTSWENRLLYFKTQHNISAQFIVGLSRNYRLFDSKNDKNIFGGCFTAPLLLGYVEYILEESITNNISTLYFIARDGYILKNMADIIIKMRNLKIKTRYLYGSRKAWRMPSIINKIPNNLFSNQWLFDTDNIKYAKDISKFFDIEWNFLKNLLPEKYKDPKHPITDSDIDLISDYLIGNSNFKEKLFNINSKKRKNVQAYLKQEVNFKENNGFVDFYGLGLTSNCFYKIIKNLNINTNYLYFTFKNESYRYNNKHTRQYQGFGHVFWILEPLLRAPHGQTIGYQKIKGKVCPILEKTESSAIINWGFYNYCQGINKFIKKYEILKKSINFEIDFIGIFINYYESIWNDAFLIEMIGSMPFDTRVGETNGREFAPKITKKQAIKYVFTGKYPQNTSWINASYFRSSDKIKKILSLRRFLNGQSKIYGPIKKIYHVISK